MGIPLSRTSSRGSGGPGSARLSGTSSGGSSERLSGGSSGRGGGGGGGGGGAGRGSRPRAGGSQLEPLLEAEESAGVTRPASPDPEMGGGRHRGNE